jgi:outer membrane receptor protein involved in Fe transport
MDLIPSDMISTIEVNKTLTPDMDADAIGGSVNLITRASPTDKGSPLHWPEGSTRSVKKATIQPGWYMETVS